MTAHPTRFGDFLVTAIGVLVAFACGGTDPTGPGGGPGDPGSQPQAVASIRVEPDTPELVLGRTLRLQAIPLSASGRELRDRPVTWHSSDDSKATVDADGTVTALAAGVVPLTVSSEAVTRRMIVTVLPIPPASIWLDVSDLALMEGEGAALRAEVRDSLDRPLPDLTVTWTSLDPSVATVDVAGRVTAVRRGATFVVARHMALEAAARVEVRDFLAADVLYHVFDPTETLPRVHRADPNDPDHLGQSLFGSSGTWQAAASPDGSRLAFVCTSSGPSICVSNSDGSNARSLTMDDLSFEDHPSWSPDGSRIAFRRWPQGGTPGLGAVTDIWVMNADGTAQVNLTDDAEMQHDPAWSPELSDGSSRIAYVQTQRVGGYLTSRLFTMATDGTDRRVETPEDGSTATGPAWSPDGRRIAYIKNGGTVTADVWVTNVGLQQEAPLMAEPLDGEQHGPAYSPDGRYVLFTSAHELTDGTAYRQQLYTVRADGTDLVRRSGGTLDKYEPTWIVRP